MGDSWNRCDDCGRFIPLNDFAEGKALHRLLEPDSDLGSEQWETLCAKHNSTNENGPISGAASGVERAVPPMTSKGALPLFPQPCAHLMRVTTGRSTVGGMRSER